MFGPRKKEASLPPVRLPKLPQPPGFDDFNYLMNQAQKNRGRTVEMPWSSSDRSVSWMLTVRCELEGGDPAWLLYRGEGPGQQVTFSYASGDLPLMFNLVMNECSGTTAYRETSQSETYASLKPVTAGGADSYAPAPQGAAPLDSGTFATVARGSGKATLEGDLKDMQMPNLLQSIAISKMTGRLGVQSPSGSAEVYFEDGSPVHAAVADAAGDIALMDLLTWEEGQFLFFPMERTHERTVKKRLDAALMEGVTLLDQSKYLTNYGLTPESYLLRKQANLSEQQFEQMVSRGAPLDMLAQKQFYQSIDNKSTLFETLRRRPMHKTEWVPLMFNMLTCDLVTISDKSPVAPKTAPLEAMGIDRATMQAVLKNLSRPETGLFTYPTLLYFAEREFFRFESYGYPFAVIIFEVRARLSGPESPPEPLPLPTVKEMARRIEKMKRNLDVFGHFETFDYGLVLPNTNTAQAAVLAASLAESLTKKPLSADFDPRGLCFAAGVASCPEDCQELGLVLAAAREARNRAKRAGKPFTLFRDTPR